LRYDPLATKFDGEKSSRNAAYVDAVARTNVVVSVDNIRRRSPLLADLEKKGAIQIAGEMYDLSSGTVEFFVGEGPLPEPIAGGPRVELEPNCLVRAFEVRSPDA
jgi:carbonic anhydrase